MSDIEIHVDDAAIALDTDAIVEMFVINNGVFST